MIEIIYFIGAIIAFLLGMILYLKEDDEEIQLEMIIPITLMSWITVFLIIWEYRK